MTVHGLQNMVQENLRSVMGPFKRSDESLSQVVYDRIKCSKWPNQVLHSWRFMGIGDFIESSLSDMQASVYRRDLEQTAGFPVSRLH